MLNVCIMEFISCRLSIEIILSLIYIKTYFPYLEEFQKPLLQMHQCLSLKNVHLMQLD